MKKFLLLAISLLLLGLPNAQARNSAASYDKNYGSQDEYVQAYNSSTAPMYRDYVVGLLFGTVDNSQTAPAINPNVNLGQYVTEATGTTTDSEYVFGVVDEFIPPGQLGRICIRGPHKVVVNTTRVNTGAATFAVGAPLSQCVSAVNWINNPNSIQIGNTNYNAVNGGGACLFSTAAITTASLPGSGGGILGWLINTTATTDSGDVGTSTNIQNQGSSTWSEYWAWINPQINR